jgi:phenylacetate-coenzyme A ligase PaaK-like adenylate-forming protein
LDNFKSFESLLYTVNDANMGDIALRLFRYQANHNPLYARYLHHLGVAPDSIRELSAIPFLPISFFKRHTIKTESWNDEAIYTSSGTTGDMTSTHHIRDVNFYLQNAERCFNQFFGPLTDYHILALMPSYLERDNSSLIAMIQSFIQKSQSDVSGFYLYEHDKLLRDLDRLKKHGNKKIILWGVSFALLDLAEKHSPDLSNCLIFETGGMKGRRKEITREELHGYLKKYLNVKSVYSEYGMTELQSQAYTRGGDAFYPPPWMKVIARETGDPFEKGQIGRAGGLNLIDLANFHSIAFIETEDAGTVFADGSFEVLGRLDNSDVRGCNLLVE